MMLLAREIIGHEDEDRFARRTRDEVAVAWDEASKPRLRRRSAAGRDVAIDLGRGAHLADGDVLHDDGETVVVVRRTTEQALVVQFDASAAPELLIADAIRLGHAFGNQHVPLATENAVVTIPLTTSAEIALRTVTELGLRHAEARLEQVRLGARQRLQQGTGHHHHEKPGHHHHEAGTADHEH